MDHPYLVVHSATAPGAAEATKKLQEEEAQGLLQGICGVCHDPLEDPVVSSCKHAFCKACMTEYMDGAQGQAKCPSCDKPLTVDLNASASVSSLDLCTCIQYQDIYIGSCYVGHVQHINLYCCTCVYIHMYRHILCVHFFSSFNTRFSAAPSTLCIMDTDLCFLYIALFWVVGSVALLN